jgi:hypothetical protein
MLARIIGGLSKANIAVILAIVSDTTTETERNQAMVIIKRQFFVDIYLSSSSSISFNNTFSI